MPTDPRPGEPAARGGGCATCGHARLLAVVETLSVSLPRAEVVASVAVPARRCGRCGGVHVDGDTHERVRLAVACALADGGVHCGDALRYMRKALGLRAADLAALLGVTAETVSHWETGRAQPARAAFVVVAAMADDAIAGRTTTRDRLERIATQRPLPRSVAVKLPEVEARPRVGRDRRS